MSVKIRLTPTLFDKLVHGNPLSGLPTEGDMPSVSREDFRNFAVTNVERFTESSLRASIRRDVAWLLNTLALESAQDLDAYPRVKDSVLNFGVRDFSGRSIGTGSKREHAKEIRAAIRRFEPRLDPRSVRVMPVESPDLPEKTSYVIEADILGGPRPMSVRYRTDIDVETSAVEVRE